MFNALSLHSRNSVDARRSGNASRWLALIFGMLIAVMLSGCAIQLAPDYDAKLHEGLVEANKDALTLFAKVETGSKQTEYAKLSDEYASVIASFDALRQRAVARQNPPLTQRLARMKFFASFCDAKNDPEDCLSSTNRALDGMVNVLRQLRDTHQVRDLSVERVDTLRKSYDQKIDQALTVETALKR
jgi:hypothetical protein